MKRAALVAGTAALVAAGWSANGAAGERARVARAAEALGMESPALLAVSRDGARLLLRDSRPRSFQLRAATRGGRTLATLSWARKPVLATWRPDGGAVAFLADRDGGQEYRIHLWDVATGRVRVLDAPATRVPHALAWNGAGTRLAYVSAPRQGSRTLYVVDPAGGPPRAVLTDVAPRAGVAWSPDGRRLAAARTQPRGVVAVVDAEGGGSRRAFLARGAEVRELAWRADGGALLAAARPAGAGFFTLVEADIGAGAVRTLAAPAEDVSAPAWLADGRILYHVNHDSERRPVTCSAAGTGCRPLAFAGTSTELLGISGDSAYLVVRPRDRAPSAVAQPLDGSAARGVYTPPPSRAGSAGERVDIPARDGMMIPAYVWRAPRRPGRAAAAVIRVHGGPAVQAGRGWDASVQYLVDAGVDVILLNYRGSTGYGAGFERAGRDEDRVVDDILAARTYAVRSLGVSADRVILYGHSYGALLAARAAARDSSIRRVVLVSMTEGGGPDAFSAPAGRRVLLFHGENDALPPACARAAVERVLGRGALRGSAGRARTFAGEGHVFERLESWAEVYAAVARLAEEP